MKVAGDFSGFDEPARPGVGSVPNPAGTKIANGSSMEDRANRLGPEFLKALLQLCSRGEPLDNVGVGREGGRGGTAEEENHAVPGGLQGLCQSQTQLARGEVGEDANPVHGFARRAGGDQAVHGRGRGPGFKGPFTWQSAWASPRRGTGR